eukprot:Opistho-1_new@24543
MEQDRRVRREIANSNERRRMQSINAGFDQLKELIPHCDGEKWSKATILQQSADYIRALQGSKLSLEEENAKLRRLLCNYSQGDADSVPRTANCDVRFASKLEDMEVSDEGDLSDSSAAVVPGQTPPTASHIERARAAAMPSYSAPLATSPPVTSGHWYGAGATWSGPQDTHMQGADDPVDMGRHNLNTIVEAMRHLEGEALDDPYGDGSKRSRSRTNSRSRPMPMGGRKLSVS